MTARTKLVICIIITLLAITFSAAIPVKSARAQENGWTKTTLDNFYLTSLETTPWGLLAGENDSRAWKNPFNGIYISKDLGNTWLESGLNKRGVTDITYNSFKIYASTYYFVDSIVGLFISSDGGKTWAHSGQNFSASATAALNNTIYLGGFSHGLWVSQDDGETWEQKIGQGFYGPHVYAVEVSSDFAIAALENNTYISTDNGNTWSETYDLSNQNIRYLEIHENMVLAGASNNSGMFKSADYGKTWEKLDGWGNVACGAIKYYKGNFYAGKLIPENNKYGLFRSMDFGLTWKDTGLELPYNGSILDLVWLYSKPSYLFTAAAYDGIYKYTIPKVPIEAYPFLSIPWPTTRNSELIEKIHSFFDHEYPLLGYYYLQEPAETQDTTLNYLGKRESEPYMFYSSHDGFDYALPHRTPILAAASGFATYSYDSDLGHTLRIDHQNGYETTYAHLQTEGLVTKDTVWVDTGQQIGLVGLTGNTTGPHLHFSIVKDLDGNSDFTNDNPDGKVDPYAWQADKLADPWPNYSWSDSQGAHSGSKSLYLWTELIPENVKYVGGETSEIAFDNKVITIDENSSEYNFTVFVSPYATPRFPITQNKFTYITGTSLLVNLYGNLGEELPNLLKPMKIEVDFSNANLDDVLENTLNIHYWNEEEELWEVIPSVVDLANRIITGETTRQSNFAVIGEKKFDYLDKVIIVNSEFAVE